MELLYGETLADRLRRDGRSRRRRSCPSRQMAAGLAAAHRAGVVHRDFKSHNVMLVEAKRADEELRVVVTDFGLARRSTRDHASSFSLSMTEVTEISGTPAYMAPEQVEGGPVTPATDVYAFGVVLYELVTGVWPFVADTPMRTANKRLLEPPPTPRPRPRHRSSLGGDDSPLSCTRTRGSVCQYRGRRRGAGSRRSSRRQRAARRWPVALAGRVPLIVCRPRRRLALPGTPRTDTGHHLNRRAAVETTSTKPSRTTCPTASAKRSSAVSRSCRGSRSSRTVHRHATRARNLTCGRSRARSTLSRFWPARWSSAATASRSASS